MSMKQIILSLLFFATLTTACDSEWALDPQNQGRAYIINKSEGDITFKAYTQNSGSLYKHFTIHPGDTVCVSGNGGYERSPNWNRLVAARWEPFLATVAEQSYMSGNKIHHLQHTISILTSPTDSISWTLDLENIPDDSIFNESNWEKDVSDGGYHNDSSWFYTFE